MEEAAKLENFITLESTNEMTIVDLEHKQKFSMATRICLTPAAGSFVGVITVVNKEGAGGDSGAPVTFDRRNYSLGQRFFLVGWNDR